MSNNMLLYVIYAVGGIFVFIVIAFLILNKRMDKSERAWRSGLHA